MKRFCLGAAVVLALLLSACGDGPRQEQIQVSVAETEELAVENNGQWITPGESAAFLLRVAPGRGISGVLYGGGWRLSTEGEYTRLELLEVRYPSRVEVELTDAGHCRGITYEPNGGEGTPRTVLYSVLAHSRPNTSTGDLFAREGFTLTGWNTAPDGSGLRVGLGSRVSVPSEGLVLYAQWQRWTEEGAFDAVAGADGVTITGYRGEDRTVAVPGRIGGVPVTAIAASAFAGCSAEVVILPESLVTVEEGAFSGAALRELVLFDSVGTISDGAFRDCSALQTLRINAAEDPYGYQYRRESLYADKVDLLINARGEKKLVFYGGCSMWYNLIGSEAAERFPDYTVINMGLNGTVNSLVQMEIMGAFLEEGDILFHTPELSSPKQLLTDTDMYDGDEKLWCGLEYNYDLFALVDIRGMDGVFDSLCTYLQMKQPGGSYADEYRDADGNLYLDGTGGVPLERTETGLNLADTVSLDPACLEDGLPALKEIYDWYQEKGVRVYLSYACVDRNALPAWEQNNVERMDRLFRETVEAMEGPAVISSLGDYLYISRDFYDTHYHLLTRKAYENTLKWLRDLEAQMAADGLIS